MSNNDKKRVGKRGKGDFWRIRDQQPLFLAVFGRFLPEFRLFFCFFSAARCTFPRGVFFYYHDRRVFENFCVFGRVEDSGKAFRHKKTIAHALRYEFP